MLRRSIALILATGLAAAACTRPPERPDAPEDPPTEPAEARRDEPRGAARDDPTLDPEAAAVLAAHNEARAAAGVPALRWSAGLATGAAAWAAELGGGDRCRLRHGDTRFGENLYACAGACPAGAEGLRAAVAGWAGEAEWYDARADACSAPAGDSCGHYTQVVWCDSRELGCARAACGGSGFVVVCRYDPPGNWRGRSPFDCTVPGG